MTTGYSGTPLSRKLGIKEGQVVATLGAPPGFADLLEPLPTGVRIVGRPRRGRGYDVVVAFVRSARELSRALQRGDALLAVAGGLWICWPKRSSPLASEVRERDVRELGLATGLVDNKICAVDADWSGLRFVVRLEDRASRRG